MENNNKLNDIVREVGEPLDTTKEQVMTTDTVIDTLGLDIDITPQYEFDKHGVIPGEKVEMPLMSMNDMTIADKDEAETNLIKMAAVQKLEKEKAAFNKLSDEEKVRIAVIQDLYSYNLSMFFNENHFHMDGPGKKRLRKKLERDWTKGKIRPNRKQWDEILYKLNLSSNTAGTDTPQAAVSKPVGQYDDIRALMH